MTDGMLAREALERKEAWAFLGDGVRMLLASSPEFRERCREMLGSGRGCLEFEEDLRGAVLRGAARGASEVLSELDGELDAPSCEGCGARMHRRGTRALSPLSLLGRLELKRGYWRCPSCAKGAGAHPLDRALGVAGRAGVRLTPAALRALAEEASEKSFAKAAESLGRQAGVWATAKRAERAAKQAGREIAAWDRSAPGLAEAPAETMYCSPDGTGVPMVRRDAGTGEDGQPAKTREAKVAVFHTAERSPRTGLPERDAGSARHTAAIDSARSKDADPQPSPFAQRLWRAARRFGFAAAKRQVVVGDGAKWIWNTAAELFPNAVCIVDVWHARERLWEVGRTMHGAGTRRCRAWSEKVCAALSEGRIEDVPRELRRHAGEPAADKAIGYFVNNRSRMRYPRYRAIGLLVGSGVVEGSCGTLTRRPLQTRRHALEQGRRQRHPAPARLHPQRTVRRLLAPAARTANPRAGAAGALKRRTPTPLTTLAERALVRPKYADASPAAQRVPRRIRRMLFRRGLRARLPLLQLRRRDVLRARRRCLRCWRRTARRGAGVLARPTAASRRRCSCRAAPPARSRA